MKSEASAILVGSTVVIMMLLMVVIYVVVIVMILRTVVFIARPSHATSFSLVPGAGDDARKDSFALSGGGGGGPLVRPLPAAGFSNAGAADSG